MLFCVLFLIAATARADFYRCQDASGAVVYTADKEKAKALADCELIRNIRAPAAPEPEPEDFPLPTENSAMTREAPAEKLSARNIFDKVWQSVVVVRAFKSAKEESLGSGVVVADREVATNCHVVADADRIVVSRAADKDEGASGDLGASLKHRDNERDVCLLSVPGLSGAVAAQMREARSLEVGETVYAVGAPQGYEYTISGGIVSQLRADDDGSPPMIQTDAAISSGSSGGGLFDAGGNLVGLTTKGHRKGQNLNFAVPAEWIEETRQKSASAKSESEEWADHARELIKRKRWRALRSHSRRWIKVNPDNFFAWYYSGIAHYKLNDPYDAARAYRTALEINPQSAPLWHILGHLYFEIASQSYYSSDYNDDAISAYRNSLRLDPENASAWHSLGVVYQRIRRHDKAEAAYSEARRLSNKAELERTPLE